MLVALWKQAGAGAEAGVGAGAGMTRTTQEAGALVTGLLAGVQVDPSFLAQDAAGRFTGTCTCLNGIAVSAISVSNPLRSKQQDLSCPNTGHLHEHCSSGQHHDNNATSSCIRLDT